MGSYGEPAHASRSLVRQYGAKNVYAGRKGEQRTVYLLNQTFQNEPTVRVFHNLRIPGGRADRHGNIDHLVLNGREALLLDSKQWVGGTYWTLFGKTFRGTQRAAHADNNILEYAAHCLKPRLPARTRIHLALVLHSSRSTPINTTLYRAGRGIHVITVKAGQGSLRDEMRRIIGAPSPSFPDPFTERFLIGLTEGRIG